MDLRSSVVPEGPYSVAYALSLSASLLSAGLTYAYVGGGIATELNPVIATVIAVLGFETMVVVKFLTVIGAYWALYWVGRAASIERAALLFAWVGATINGVDAVHDLRVAVVAGTEGTATPPVLFVLLAVGLFVGTVFGPLDR
jgi:hypothetical protein